MTTSLPGYFMVDVGKLIGLYAASPGDAAELVRLPIYGNDEETPLSQDVRAVYRIGEAGEVLEVLRA